ncbi:DMT family transporter [Tabrizicola sp.]|jgi:drug/metabolite transporter (DMT)-like permease|uniref:DMT family transporter n=1 Tax=Tabrizicola sp. TaxID=2005166 RepID=UPI0025EA316B|nr:DMT family transporter [Tabrizicola sp.]MBY0352357.1 DMT family transporter [Tabrizicola sp.]
MQITATQRGILALVVGIAVFSLQDVILKRLSGDYPLYQAMIIRSLTAVPLLLIILRLFDGRLTTIATPNWALMLARGILNFVAYTAYYLGLAALPMADTVALFFTAPLFITIAAALVFRDRIGATNILALLAGFVGMLMIFNPSASVFDPAALLPVLAALGYALTQLATRVLGRTETAAAMTFWGNLTFLAGALALAAVFGSGAYDGATHPSLAFLTRGWQPMPARDLGLFMACGVIASIGLSLLTYAYRVAPSASVAPFEYSFIIWGVLWGWVFWAQLPAALAWGGIALLIGAGLLVIRAEAQTTKAAPEGAA